MRRNDRDAGSATLEFAMVLPMLLLVVVAMVQVGLIVRDQLILVEAARAGAREAAVTDSDDEVRAAVERAAAGLAASRLDMTLDRDAGGQGTPVLVRLHYDDAVSIPMVAWLFPEVIELRSEATMRREYP